MYRIVITVFTGIFMIICTLGNTGVVLASKEKGISEKLESKILKQLISEEQLPVSTSIRSNQQGEVNTEIRIREEVSSPQPSQSQDLPNTGNGLEDSENDSVAPSLVPLNEPSSTGQTELPETDQGSVENNQSIESVSGLSSSSSPSSTPTASQQSERPTSGSTQEVNNTQSFINDESNYYQEFNLDKDTGLFLLLLALACFLTGLGLIKFDAYRVNSFSERKDFNYPLVR